MKRAAINGVGSAGFATTVFPVASAGAIYRQMREIAERLPSAKDDLGAKAQKYLRLSSLSAYLVLMTHKVAGPLFKTSMYFDRIAFLRVEHDQLVGVHMRDVQTALRGIKILIVKANRRARERNIRDQAPLRLQILEGCLTDMSVRECLSILNDRVFFWLHPAKLDRLLGARRYRAFEQDVLVIDTRSLLNAHAASVRLSPINSGATLYPKATPRGSETFTTIEDYPYAERRRRKTVSDAVTELAVINGVHDARDHVICVERWRGKDTIDTGASSLTCS